MDVRGAFRAQQTAVRDVERQHIPRIQGETPGSRGRRRIAVLRATLWARYPTMVVVAGVIGYTANEVVVGCDFEANGRVVVR